jgi:uncharacterized membrane protein YphA (DoxX/SURF4 family)
MTARDIFGLILRLFLVWVFIWGCWQLAAALSYLPASVQSWLTGVHLPYTSFNYAVYGLPAVLVSAIALRFANAIIYFTYRG